MRRLSGAAADLTITKLEKPLLECFPFLSKILPIRLAQLERAYERLESALRNIEINQDAERQLGFVNMSFRYFEAGAKEHREIKLAILASACAHCAEVSNDDPFDAQLEYFDAIEKLQPHHLRILAYLEKHHTEPSTEGRHTHPASAMISELAKENFGIPEPQEMWLVKSVLTLRDLTAIRIVGGSGMARVGARFAPIVEPDQIVLRAKIGLGRFGCRLFRYIKNAPINHEF